jgi:lambda repressor-like predicted transcriptional regulator
MDHIDELPKNIIKAEMARKGIKVKAMIALLKPYGEELSELSFNNKMARKTFSAIFFMKCMKALDVNQVKIEG